MRWILMLIILFANGGCRPETKEVLSSSERNPSVLFYLIDTCRTDRMSLYGHNRRTTPFLDYLAKNSVVFENCYSQASWTKPSVGSMLASKYPSEIGCNLLFQRISSKVLTFPEVLKENGYFTKGVSANPIMGVFSNYSQGFVEFTESARINKADPIRFASGSAKLINNIVFPWLTKTNHWPMFLFLFSVDPHEEYEPDPIFRNRFADSQRMEQYRKDWKALLKTRPLVPGNRVTEDNFKKAEVEVQPFIEHGLNLYDGDICANDYELLRLWSRIEDDAWGEDMICVITSDHGEEFFEHGGTCHGYSLYNELLHVPLLIYAPKLLPQGVRIKNPVRTLDIYPTLLDLLDIKIPEDIKGRSLVPLMKNQGPWEDMPVYSETNEDASARKMGSASGVARSMIFKDWKFIINFKSPSDVKRPRYELFNLKEDPKETTNLADAKPKLKNQFEKRLLKWSSENIRDIGPGDTMDKSRTDPVILEQLKRLGYLK